VLIEDDALGGEAVQVGGGNPVVAITTEIAHVQGGN
jgi:hypothetical protein